MRWNIGTQGYVFAMLVKDMWGLSFHAMCKKPGLNILIYSIPSRGVVCMTPTDPRKNRVFPIQLLSRFSLAERCDACLQNAPAETELPIYSCYPCYNPDLMAERCDAWLQQVSGKKNQSFLYSAAWQSDVTHDSGRSQKEQCFLKI